ncbi:MAG: hypothetical protein HY365_03845 [Candidatus Aenigmarchaeota archaeon]|nr:hypothetical protein [Candidatus Aenigmarchaeota archaeon]
MKGVSTLVAAVLLVGIVLVASTLALNWMVNLQSSTGNSISNKTMECNTAAVVIDKVYLDTANSVGRIVVRNSGFDDDAISGALITNTRGQTTTNLTQLPVTLTRGSQTSISLNLTNVITACANFSRAFISTRCGVSGEYGTAGETPVCS